MIQKYSSVDMWISARRKHKGTAPLDRPSSEREGDRGGRRNALALETPPRARALPVDEGRGRERELRPDWNDDDEGADCVMTTPEEREGEAESRGSTTLWNALERASCTFGDEERRAL